MPKSKKPTKRSFKSLRPFGAIAIQKRRMVAAPRKIEIKCAPNVVAAATFTLAGAITLVSTVTQGDTVFDRDANHIAWDWATVRIRLNTAAAGVAADCAARVILFWDKKGLVAPAVVDVLNAVPALDAQSGYNPAGDGRFEILADKHYPTASGPSSTYTTYSVMDSFTVSLKGKKSHYIGAGAGIAAIDSGALYILTVGDSLVAPMVGDIKVDSRFHEL